VGRSHAPARVADARATLARPLDRLTVARWIANLFGSSPS
jgi:hypothetical protein